MKMRVEHDSMGEVLVDENAYWGAQTQRSLQHFPAGPLIPLSFIHVLAMIKKACALANADCDVLPKDKATLIAKACDEIIAGKLDDQFPLHVYQTGSGTQTNMNVNEVIANRAHVLNGGKLIDKKKILHPNDDVNKSQSSNDIVPVAMHIATYLALTKDVIPVVSDLQKTLSAKSKKFATIVKVGRTHTMDAVPLTVSQEFSGWVGQLESDVTTLKECLNDLLELPVGGTAIGTGLNTPKDFDKKAVQYINKFTGAPFKVAKNKFMSIAAHGALVKASATLKVAAIDLKLIANNIRLLASGPRTGIGELILPENEPGSSIMPGKVNPTQAEALMQACIKVIANDIAVSLGGAMGEFQLNLAKPLIISSLLESADILTKTCRSFDERLAKGIQVNKKRVRENLDKTLMLVTALVPHIGYEKAAKIAQQASREDRTLKDVAIEHSIKEKDFDRWVDPKKMV